MERITVSSGVTSSGLTATGQEILTVLSGGTIADTTEQNRSRDRLSGGTAQHTLLTGKSTEAVFSGGTAIDTSATNMSLQIVRRGGVASGTRLTRSATQEILRDGVASGTFMSGADTQMLVAGGLAAELQDYGGRVTVTSNGYLAGATTIANGGVLTLDDGSAVGTTLLEDGTIVIEQGLLRNLTAARSQANVVTVSDGGRLVRAFVYSGTLNVDGGVASGGFVEKGTLNVAFGGVVSSSVIGVEATGTIGMDGTVSSVLVYGSLNVQQGGTLVSAIISSGGHVSLGVGASALDVDVQSGGFVALAATSSYNATFDLEQGAVVGVLTPYMAGAAVSLDSATDVLTLTEGSSSVSLQLIGDYTSDAFVVSSVNSNPDLTQIYVDVAPLVVSSGVTSSGLTFQGQNRLTVLSGGTVISTTFVGSSQELVSGGTASHSVLSQQARDYVVGGGHAIDTVIKFDAFQFVSSGGIASDVTVSSGGEQVVGQGGTAFDTRLLSGAYLDVAASGALLSDVTIGNAELIVDGGTVDAAGGSGYVYVDSGAVVSGLTLDDTSATFVQFAPPGIYIDGGTIIDLHANDVEYRQVKSGGTLNGAVLSGRTDLDLDSGSVTNVDILSGATLNAISGTIQGTTVHSGGLFQISAATPLDTTILLGGTIQLDFLAFQSSGHASYDASTQQLTVIEGTSSTTLTLAGNYAGDEFYVEQGRDNATNILLLPAIGSGGLVVSSGVTSSGLLLSGTQQVTVLSGGSIVNASLHGSSTEVLSGGTALRSYLADHATEQVLAGAIATSSTVQSGASQVVGAGGSAVSGIIEYGASQVVQAGGSAVHTVLRGNGIVDSGGMVSGTSNGGLLVVSGGIAETLSGSGDYVLNGGTISGLIQDAPYIPATITVSGGTLIGLDAAGKAALITILGGAVSASQIENASTLDLAAGSVTGLDISNDAVLSLGGGTARDVTVLSGGIIQVGAGAALPTNTAFAIDGMVDLQGLTFADQLSATFNSSTDQLTVSEGGRQDVLNLANGSDTLSFQIGADSAGGTTITAASRGQTGVITVSSGVTSSGLNLEHAESLGVQSGGHALNATLSDTSQDFLFGGAATGTILEGTAVETIFSGGLATSSVVDGGTQIVSAGGSAVATTVSSGTQIIRAGGTATATITHGSLIVAGTALNAQLTGVGASILAGGVASNLQVTKGTVQVSSGGTILGLTMSSAQQTAIVVISSGASATSATLNGNYFVELINAGTVTGVQLLSGATFHNYDGGTVVSAVIGSGSTLFALSEPFQGAAAAPQVEQATTVQSGGVLYVSGHNDLPTDTYLLAGGMIDLAKLAYAGQTSAAFDSTTDQLTVTEGGTSVTLQLAGTYAGMSFVLASNGSKRTPGTLVKAVAAAPAALGIATSFADELRALDAAHAVAPVIMPQAHDAERPTHAIAPATQHPLVAYAEHAMLTPHLPS